MSLVTTERRPPLRQVRLDTGRRNVLTLEAVEALREAIAPDPEAPVVVLAGRPDGFCSGLDNQTLARGGAPREELLAATGELLLTAIAGPTRIVALCEGHAVAAGAMLLLCADLRLGTGGDYRIGFTEPALGMPLPELPLLLARERLARNRLHELTVLGRVLGPEQAATAGFLDRVVERDELEAEALRSASEIAALTDVAYRETLAALWGPTLERITILVAEQARRRDAVRDELV